MPVIKLAADDQPYAADFDEAIDALESLPTPIDYRRGTIILHQGPVWISIAIAHWLVAAWVGYLDSDLRTAVVVKSHKAGVKVGDIIKIPMRTLPPILALICRWLGRQPSATLTITAGIIPLALAVK
jgi:CRISPR-associated Csx3 family protein